MPPVFKAVLGIFVAALALNGCAAPRSQANAPGETPQPPATPLPTRPPFPTMAALNQPNTSEMQTIMQLPDVILSVDVAVNPVNGDPVAAAIATPLTSQGSAHAFVRAYDGATKTWSVTQNVDIGEAAIGLHRFRSVALAVSGDGTITIVWGASAHPNYGLWASTSRDNGATWDAPYLLADNVFGVLDVTAAISGEIAVLALGREPAAPLLVTRDRAGLWSTPSLVPVASAWYGTGGSIVITGEGSAARVVALTTGFREASGRVFLASRSLRGGDTWRIETRQLAKPIGEGLIGRVRGLAAEMNSQNGLQPLVAFSFVVLNAPEVYAVVSLDGGESWGDITEITNGSEPASATAPFGALAFDSAAERLVAVWTCCEDARWGAKASTHYGAWNVPGSGEWQSQAQTPLITGAVAAADSALAQAPNTRYAWLAWVERGTTIAIRAIDLNRVVASDQYPTPTPQLPPKGEGQP